MIILSGFWFLFLICYEVIFLIVIGGIEIWLFFFLNVMNDVWFGWIVGFY